MVQAIAHTTEMTMRYLVERTLPDGLALPANSQGAQARAAVVANNTRDGVTWTIETGKRMRSVGKKC